MGFDDDSMGFSSKNGDSKGSYIYEVFIESKKGNFVGHSWGHLAQRLLLDGIMQFSWFFFIRIY